MSDPLGGGWTSDRDKESRKHEAIEGLETALRDALQERDAAREETLEMVWERNEARAQLRWEQGVVRQLTRQRDDAQEAAEAYWEAWQGSVNANQKIADLMGAFREERDRLREALKQYGRHECPYPLEDCTCGLASMLENH